LRTSAPKSGVRSGLQGVIKAGIVPAKMFEVMAAVPVLRGRTLAATSRSLPETALAILRETLAEI
jgi:hypothetical protein